ncbi:hypothetical protein CSA37_12975 [Candidatus Fermentibacteria bacterium]|nr:MAG: hypothetical protein CSA37_12975 [Candidatus Fermentibacteria bacterium]
MLLGGAYGSGTPEAPDEEPPELVSDFHSRTWEAELLLDYAVLDDLFFARAGAGRACFVRDYALQDSISVSRLSDDQWETTFTIGGGTRFRVDEIPVLEYMQFMVSWKAFGSEHSAVSAGIGLGL